MTYSLVGDEASARLVFTADNRTISLHPLWVRERTSEVGTIDPLSRQRLYDPADLDLNLRALAFEPDLEHTTITWSDEHIQRIVHAELAADLGWEYRADNLPNPVPWSVEPKPFPRFDFPEVGDDEGLLVALDAFWTHGFVVLNGTPTEPGSLEGIASRFGPVRQTNFGLLFDVFTKQEPVDLAYTPMELKAHTDNPYRDPVPSIQFLHCLVNDASGGESTLVDGLAASEDYKAIDPEGHEALSEVMVTYRYQFGNERLSGRSPILEFDECDTFIGIRNSDRVDFVDAVDPDLLDVFYRARSGLRKLLNDPARRATFLLRAGDVMMMNNRRLLHGRNSFELTSGTRHLQGCYIEFDGPQVLYKSLNLSQ